MRVFPCLSLSLGRKDTDKKFPVIGFGGKVGPDQPANHAFAVNFQEHSPEVDGMAGVLEVGKSRFGGAHMPYKRFGGVPNGTRSVGGRTADVGGGRRPCPGRGGGTGWPCG